MPIGNVIDRHRYPPSYVIRSAMDHTDRAGWRVDCACPCHRGQQASVIFDTRAEAERLSDGVGGGVGMIARPARGFPWRSHLSLAEADRLDLLEVRARKLGLTPSERIEIAGLRKRSLRRSRPNHTAISA